MLKKLYQKDGNIIINPPLNIKFGYFIIHHYKKEKDNLLDYQKEYYQSLGIIYPSPPKD